MPFTAIVILSLIPVLLIAAYFCFKKKIFFSTEKTPGGTQKFYESLVEHAPFCIKLFDNKGNLIFINKEGVREHSLEEGKDIKTWNWFEGIKEEYHPRIKESFDKARRGESDFVEFEHLSAESKHKWDSGAVFPIKNKGGQVEFIVFYSFDITLLKEIEESEKEEKEMLKTIFDVAPLCIEWFDKNGNLFLINRAGRKALGGDEGEKTSEGWDYTKYIDGEYREIFREKLKSALLGEAEECEIKITSKISETLWYFTLFVPVKNKEGKIEHVLCLMRNVTKEKLMEDESKKIIMKTEETKNALYNILDDVKNSEINLRRERDQSQAIISSMGEGLMVVDKEYKIILVNKKTEEILGINSEMMIKKDMREIISVYKKDQELIGDRPVMLMFQSLKTVNVKMEDEFYYNVLHNNRKFPVELIVSPLYDGENITAAIIVFQNITSRKALDEAKNSFISIASHQLRTPLTSIRWYTEMLSSEDAGPLTENQKNFLSRVYGSALKLNEVINLLLALARTESGKAAKEIVKIDPIVFTVDIIKELEPQFKPKNISVNFIPLKEPLEINYDISMLRQITSNLLSNSIHYTDKNGQIEIKIEKGKNELIYSIKDDGIGIPANQQDKIFNKFFRADNASAVVPDGSGLGLSLVKALVEMNNGKVWFESPASWVDKNGKEEKRGTVFYFTLPL